MRILIFNWRDLAHPLAGGAEVYTHEVAREWVKEGHEVTLFCSAVAGRPSIDEREGIQIIRRGSRLGVYREARDFYEHQADGRFDAVLDSVNTRPFLCPQFVRDVPVVALIYQVAREICFYETPFPIAVVGRYWLEPRWLRTYQHVRVLTISGSSRDSLAAYGLRDISIIPVGLRPPDHTPRIEKADRPTILFVGRLTPNKRPADAIKAFEIASAEVPGLALRVVGDGPLRHQLERRSPKDVQFCGRVDDFTKFNLMAEAHAVIATSVREGWGMVVSEAAAVGTPAITYAVPGLRDSVTASGGILVQAKPESLGNELIRSIPLWASGHAPQTSPGGTVPWAEVAKAVLDHLDSAVSGRAPNVATSSFTGRPRARK